MNALKFKSNLKQLLLKFSTVNAFNMKPNLLSQIIKKKKKKKINASLERNLHFNTPIEEERASLVAQR